jgi:hypothetical protein
VASGFITSAPVRVLHMMGSKLATMAATVMTLGRSRKRAPLQSGYVTNYGESGTQLRNIAFNPVAVVALWATPVARDTPSPGVSHSETATAP